MAFLDDAPLYAPPDVSWNALLLVLNCGGGDAARRLAGDRDSLSAIRGFIKFAPDWKALELALVTPRPYSPSYAPTRTFYVKPTACPDITPAMMVEYARFLGLFKGVPHGFLSPPPSWPELFGECASTQYGELSRGYRLQRIWRFHSKQDSYKEDCLTLTSREIPYYEYDDRPTCSEIGKDAGLMGYRRLYKRYVQAYGTPPDSNLWPDVTAFVILANKCQSHLDEWRGHRRDELYISGDEELEYNCDDFWDD